MGDEKCVQKFGNKPLIREACMVGYVGLKLNGTRQLLAYADDVSLLGDNVDTIKKNTETLIVASKEVALCNTSAPSTDCICHDCRSSLSS
jgi:hypothetical protein